MLHKQIEAENTKQHKLFAKGWVIFVTATSFPESQYVSFQKSNQS